MEFTHFDENGNALMVDVSEKAETKREATARGSIYMSPECLKKVKEGTMAKGDVLGVARVAGIMGAKKKSELIPLCHLLNLTKLTVDFTIKEETNEIEAACTARTTGKTGVEIPFLLHSLSKTTVREGLTGVNIALLTIYDMCKAVDKSMEMGNIYLEHKSGGKSGEFVNPRKQGI